MKMCCSPRSVLVRVSSCLAPGCLLGLALALTASAADTPAGNATGALKVNGVVTPLRYAYARAQPGFRDEAREDILVVLSDVEIPAEAQADPFARRALARDGKLHAVEVVLDADKDPISGGLADPAFSKFGGYVSVAGAHVFEAKVFDGSVVEGRMLTRGPVEAMEASFEYTATFRAAVWHRPPPTATGAEAAKSEPGRALLAFLGAVHSGDLAALKKVMTAQASAPLDGPDAAAMLEWLRQSTPDPALATISRLDLTGTTAQFEVVVKSADSTSTSRYRLVLEDEAWKLAGR